MTMGHIIKLLLAFSLLWATHSAHADELRPAYIELNQISQTPNQWAVVWKASEASPLALGEVILPKNCAMIDKQTKRSELSNQITRFTIECNGAIFEQEIGLRGLEYSKSDALVRIAAIGADQQTIRLTPNENVAFIHAPEADTIITNVASSYILLGFEHILEGYDHLLFVFALVLLIPSLRRVALTVTAFTIAHSITLIGTTLGYLSLPSKPVEAVIALSIIFLALEIVQSLKTDIPRLSQRYPWIVAFAFGLLHGFGFAGALAEIGLPQDDVALALLSFNIGVELGQLLIVVIAIALLRLIARVKPKAIKTIALFSAYAIGIIATYWFISRMIG